MQEVLFRHCFAGLFSFLLTYYLIPLFIKAAHKSGLLDAPDGKIKVHDLPIPHFGGIAVFMSFIATLALSFPFKNVVLWLLLGSTLLLLLGLIDDLHVLKPSQKFIGQIVAVACFLKGGFSLKSVFFSSWINILFSAFWMLSVINAFNLIDVMDGLSSTVALVAAVTFFFLAYVAGLHGLTLLLVTFIGALLAFFLYNKPPAKIYLGDAGAMFIGGFLASVPLLFNWSFHALNAVYAPVIILAIPLLEVTALVFIRSAKGIPFYQGSPHHFSIYLQNKGWSKSRVLLFSAGAGLVLSGVACLLVFRVIGTALTAFLGALFVGVWSVIIFSNIGNFSAKKEASYRVARRPSVNFSAKGKDR